RRWPPCFDEAARRDRPRGSEGGRARRARALEGAPPRRGPAPPTRRYPRRLDAGALDDLDPHPRESRARPRGDQPGDGPARYRRRAVLVGVADAPDHARDLTRVSLPGLVRRGPPASAPSKDLGELGGGRDLELVVAAVGRRLVWSPAQERRGVAEAIALQV